MSTLERETLIKFYQQMRLIRSAEEALLALFSEGLLRGTVHTCLGQEATAVGVISALDKERDIVCSNHRGHGHFLAYCGEVRGLIAEVMGLPSGVCGGVGGSQHMHLRNFYTNGVLGGMPPVATGMAMAEKSKKSGAIAIVFLGDGAMAEGSFYEALNFAAIWKLPILFVVEHNHYAQTTHWSQQHAGDLAKRPTDFGVPVTDIDGNDVLLVSTTAQQVIENIRATCIPHLLFLRTYRLGPHSKGDDLRDPNEIAERCELSPLVRTRQILGAEVCDTIDQQMLKAVNDVVAELRAERAI